MELHPAQVSILQTLRHAQSARYTDLQLPTSLESDTFKFHLYRLIKLQYVQKRIPGRYELTAAGKELANNLDQLQSRTQKQPKLSVAIIASRYNAGNAEYLFQQRLRHPFYGFWGTLSGPIQLAESVETTARREFEKQTGMTGHYTVRAFYRKTDYVAETNVLLEDKLFTVVEVSDVRGKITNTWQKGHNAWMTLEELEAQDKYFLSTSAFIRLLKQPMQYVTEMARYNADDY